jgi:hypothetical protein
LNEGNEMADMPMQSQDPAAGAAATAAPILSKDNGPKMKSEPKPKTEPREQRAAGGKKKKPKHTHIEHHDDGTHTSRHVDAAGKETASYTSSDLDGVHDGLEQHAGEANGDAGAGAPGGAPQDPAAGGEPQPDPNAAPAGGAPMPQPTPGA